MPRKIGVSYCTVDGENVDVKSGVEYRRAGPSRESVFGLTGFHGVRESPMPARVAMTITRPKDPRFLARLEAKEDATVVIGFRDGSTFGLSNAYRVGDPLNVTAEEDEVHLAFEGPVGDFLQ